MTLRVPMRVAHRRRQIGQSVGAIETITPVSPHPQGVPVAISGTYTGEPSSIVIVWQQGTSNISSPVGAGVMTAGTWSGTIATPTASGTYTLRAGFNGVTPVVHSDAVVVAEAAMQTIASLHFRGHRPNLISGPSSSASV